jgi:hypothetical protein
VKPVTLISRAICITLAALLLLGQFGWFADQTPIQTRAAANNQQVFLPLVAKPYSFTKAPNPLNLPVRLDLSRTSGLVLAQPAESQSSVGLDENRTVQAAVPDAGGVITATAADGALFTLEIPAGALVTDTQILLTPVAAIDGQLLGGSAGAAVQLEPDGLQFLLPVTLTIQTTAPIPVNSELTLSWHGDGKEFHRYPLVLEHPYPQVVFRTMHFSGFAYLGDNISIPIDNGVPMPSDPEDQLKQAWEEVVRREREAQANGQPGNPNFQQELIDLLRAYYNQIVKPIMTAAEGDCDYAEGGAVAKALGWAREADLLRTEDILAQERQEFDESFIRILENCWRERTQPCLNRNDLNQWRAALRIAHLGQIYGLDFNPNTVPDCNCTGYESIPAWNLTFTMSFNRTAQGTDGSGSGYVDVSVSHEQSATILLNNKKGWPPYPGWDNSPGGVDNMPSGSASINDISTDYLDDGRQFVNSTVGSGIVGGYGYLTIDEDTCTYSLDLDVVTHVVDDSFQKDPEERDMYVLGLYILDRNAYSIDPATVVLSGNGDFNAGVGGPYVEHMDLSHGYASHRLFNLFGSNVGYGHASWTLTPLP